MFQLIKAWKMLRTKPPWSNDPHLNKRYLDIIWAERNGACVGRAIMAWVALIGWLVAGWAAQ